MGRSLGRHPAFLGIAEHLASTRSPGNGANGPKKEPIVVLAKNDLRRIDVKLFGAFELYWMGSPSAKRRVRIARASSPPRCSSIRRTARRRARRDDVRRPRRRRMRANLHTTAWALRKQIGSLAVAVRRQDISAQSGLPLAADVRDFDEALAARVAQSAIP